VKYDSIFRISLWKLITWFLCVLLKNREFQLLLKDEILSFIFLLS